IRFEATFQTKKSVFKRYETSESFFINIFTLSPENLIIEKISAYLKRRKIRDLYDIFFLLNYIEKIDNVKRDLNKLIKNYKKPFDEEALAEIIITGAVPDSQQLIESIKKQVR
ncbi:MAG: nucleotidyl transferase AbiEii/AbiGii toxin family protein, partial [Nanoarchaeota archaeon]